MTDEADKKKAADIIKNAMMSRPSSDEKLSEEDKILLRMQRAMRDIARPSNPSKRSARKPRRNVSKRNVQILNSTSNYVKQIYQSPSEFARGFINVNPIISTREVGPGDRYNADQYSPGRETKSRGKPSEER